MQCHEFERRLNAALDERLSPDCDPRLREHCEQCPDCRELAAACEALFDGLDARCAAGVSDDLPTRVVAEVARLQLAAANEVAERRLRAAAAARRFAGSALALTIAAALLVAIGWQVFRAERPAAGSAPEDSPADLAAVDAGDSLEAHAAVPADEQLVQPAHGMERGVADLPAIVAPVTAALDKAALDKAAIETAAIDANEGDQYLAVMRQTGLVMAQFPNTVRRAALVEEVSTMTEKIRPVANSMSAVLDALRRTLPGKDENPKS